MASNDFISLLSLKEDEFSSMLEDWIISSDKKSLLISLIEIELGLENVKLGNSENLAFHFEISGWYKSDSHPLKISFISIWLLNFHFEILGINDNLLKKNNYIVSIIMKVYIIF